MKKIGLVTIVDYKNYGNRLQNYAGQQVLKSLGCNVVIIVNKPLKSVDTSKKNIFKSLKDKTFQDITRKAFSIISRKKRQVVLCQENGQLKLRVIL